MRDWRWEGEVEDGRTEDDVDAEAVAADEPGNAIELVRLEVRRDAKFGEAGSLALRVGGEDQVGGR